MSKKYRLVTRSDMDGLVCAVLFKELGMIGDIVFVHPKDMQDEKIEITQNALPSKHHPDCDIQLFPRTLSGLLP